MMTRSLQKVSPILLIRALDLVSALPALPVADGETATGPGGTNFADSDHFRFFDTPDDKLQPAIDMAEAALECFVETLGWRNPMLDNEDTDDADGPYTKINIYTVAGADPLLGDNAGIMTTDEETSDAYIKIMEEWVDTASVLVHEFAHVLNHHQKTWIQGEAASGTWWETLANWVYDTYATSDLCATARTNHGQKAEEDTIFEPKKVIGDSFQVIVDGSKDNGNYYQAWPFFTYLTTNPDDVPGLGRDAMLELMKQHSAGETPLHTLAKLLPENTATVADIVGKYWARMAYVDIGHPLARDKFLDTRKDDSAINFVNVDSTGPDTYKVRPDRMPRYMGANIMPLETSPGSEIKVKIETTGEYTAYLAVRQWKNWSVRYVQLFDGEATALMEKDEEPSLVIAHTPAELLSYNGFVLEGDPASVGLDYSFTMTGATVKYMP